MTRRAWTSIVTAAAMAVALPVYAQEARDQGQRPNNTGSSSGSATSRPSGGSGGSSGGGSGAVSRPSGGSSGSSVSPPSGASRPSGSYEGSRAPARPERRTGSVAVPRSSGEIPRAAAPGSTASATAGDSSDRRRAVPAYSRPRDGRPTVGTAVTRTRPPYASGAYAGGFYYDPFFRYGHFSSRYPYGYYLPGYAFGVGYFYDPWMWGYASPYGYGGYYDPYGGYGGTYSRRDYRDTGSVRLKVKPEHGQVYVDGYYVGEVDSFDGIFQRLTLEAGAHRIEIRADGYETAQFEVMIIPGETVTYKGDLTRYQ